MIHAFDVVSKKSLCNPCSQDILLEVSVLDFRSVVHYLLTFVCDRVWVQTLYFCIWISSCFSSICWKDYPFSHLNCFCTFVENQLAIWFGLFLDFILLIFMYLYIYDYTSPITRCLLLSWNQWVLLHFHLF